MTTTGSQGEGQLVTDILTSDHRAMLDLLDQVRQSQDPQERRDLMDTVIAEVMRHSVAEEMYVYPAIEQHVPNGEEEVRHDKQEHEEIVTLMKKLENEDAASPSFLEMARGLQDLVRHHAEDEENDQFPKLRTHVPHQDLVDVGAKVEKAKQLAPTRPHPSAPHSELFHKAVGPGVGMVDRLRDKLTGRGSGS